MTVLSTFLESSLNFLFNKIKKHYNLVKSGRKAVWKLELTETHFERTEVKLPVKPTSSEKMTVLSTFLESSIYVLSNNLKKHYKIWYSQWQKRCKNLNCQKHSLEGKSGTKQPVKPNWSEKIIVLITFLKFLLNFLSNNLKKHNNIWYSQGEKRCQNLCLNKTPRNTVICNLPVILVLWFGN